MNADRTAPGSGGHTVRRPARPNTGLVRRALDRLAEVDAEWAPRFVGLDGDDELVTWLPGRTVDDWWDHPGLLQQLTRTVRQLHDVTADLAAGHECLVHDDLQPRNIVVDGRRIGVIDWEQLRPGRRIEDVAQLCWSFATGPPDRKVEEVAARWRQIIESYGSRKGEDVIPVALAKISRCVDDIARLAAKGSERHRRFEERGDHRELAQLHHWIEANRDTLVDRLG